MSEPVTNPVSAEEIPTVIYPRNDSERAERFALKFGTDLRYVEAWKTWLRWNGTRWKRDRDGGVMRLAKEMPRAFLKEASGIEDEEARKRAAREAINSGDAGKLRAMVQLAGYHSQIAARPQMFDADPYVFSVRNGVIDLRTGHFRAASKDDYLTMQAGVKHDRQASCPKWIEHLHTVFAGDESLMSFFQCAVGYSLTGDTREQKLFFLYGTGQNGKSTTTETLQALLGDYAQAATSELFMINKHGKEPQAEITRLLGARFVVGSEIEEGAKLAESRVKWLTGQDTLVGRYLYAEPFDFQPTHKLWIFGNHKPDVAGNDLGIWRRMCLVPFTVQIPNEKKDPQLPEKLKSELPGILNWALEGCAKWQKQRLQIPRVVSTATDEYRNDEDELAEFVEEECKTEGEVTKSALHDRYRHWALWRGIKMPLRPKAFAKRMLSRAGISERRDGIARYWTGICLRPMRVSFA
jgi:putative DNA primase/helicase